MQQTVYIPQEENNEELTIDLKKIFFALWHRKNLIIAIFLICILAFASLTFVLSKKYTVTADLYINKTTSSNLIEFNPFALDEVGAAGGGVAALMSGGNNALANEMELIKSPLVIDKVIKENNLVYGKKFGIIPNKREGEYLSAAAFIGKGKNPSFENKKGTNVLTIEYKSKDPELAYNVVNSIINNYIEFYKQINYDKSKSDKEFLETEYQKARKILNEKVNTMNGLPEQAMMSTGNLTAMSAFSRSAQQALSTIKGQVKTGSLSRIDVTEESAKVAALSSKLEWAKMVEEMSDSSKVLVLKEPQKLRDFEYSSPKLLVNILLGIVFGFIASLLAVFFAENTDKKLTYSMLGENIIYNLKNDFSDLKLILLANQDKKVAIVSFENIPDDIQLQLKEYRNVSLINADISNEFVQNVKHTDEIIIFATIGKTNSKFYKQIKTMIAEMNKKVVQEVLIK